MVSDQVYEGSDWVYVESPGVFWWELWVYDKSGDPDDGALPRHGLSLW